LGTRTLEDESALWLQAYQEHGQSILAFLISRIGRRELAEEFLQETFVRAMRRGAGSISSDRLRSYLFTTAHHLVVSERRRGKARLFSELSQSEKALAMEPRVEPAPSGEDLDLERVRRRLDAALAALSPDHREAFRAAVMEQKPYAEIARERGWSAEQVKINVHRARKKVIALLRDLVTTGAREEGK
jgi:RNA polymerase sigma-70 factor, ECF subfamily